MSEQSRDLAISTLCAHAGSPAPRDVGAGARSHVSPIYQQSVFDFSAIDDAARVIADGDGYVYRRNGMPNADELGAAVAALEGCEAGLATSSGMGAIAALTLGHCQAGDIVLLQRDAYGGTPALLGGELSRFGLEVRPVNAYEPEAIDLAGARMLVCESISNPLLRRAPIGRLAERCREAGVLLAVDNTFATPLGSRPAGEGADVVVHSVTKFLGGHHDVCAGALAGDRDRIARARIAATRFGLACGPMDAWLAVRGLRTLEVRMTRAWKSAAQLAARLREHAAVGEVHAAERCALVSFDLGSREAAARVVAGCELIALCPSLGGVTTTLSHPATSSHVSLTEAERAAAGIGDGLLRLCVGIEDPDDLWRDLDAALAP